jgi:hypothetical protein
LGKRSRKRSARPAAAKPRPPRPPSEPSRSELKNAAAREALVPLREGERPTAVTIAAIVAAVLAIINTIPYITGREIANQEPHPGVLVFSFILFVAAIGMWRVKYWAVLGMQALLALIILAFAGVYAPRSSNIQSALIATAIIVASGVLFWKLVKAMARIQMPERPQ